MYYVPNNVPLDSNSNFLDLGMRKYGSVKYLEISKIFLIMSCFSIILKKLSTLLGSVSDLTSKASI